MLFNLNEDGQGFLEYGLLIILIAVIVIAILTLFGMYVGDLFSNIIMEV